MKSKSREVISPLGEKRLIFTGDMDLNEKTISELAEMGVKYFVVSPSPDGKVPVKDQLVALKTFHRHIIS